ncbi:hypothetical protein EHQ12_01720 [Leptospira gomenensis]|uniref:Thioredoxin domain-containing protein n=1 Tax=Leptospira gomenensis TaxID=2484974 RepID=A0A5F1YE31_9LEPT|nr:hypothetical protein EHQ17_04385 [Leptospira gomenensis]TGK43410.1 hypothetical protein EHQ07_12620 [Leptospira gomenensis]TGK44413.1 hypothetical protein EHQ12_01720 [Leptospira gomenensis]TGK67539.1 hypothetical protein EHQ13_01910 [Leptospira gomenensis]
MAGILISVFTLFIPFRGTVFGESLSNFAFFNLKSERIVLSDFLKEVAEEDLLLVHFTGSACAPCKEQVPLLMDWIKFRNGTVKGRIYLWVIFVGDSLETANEYSNLLKLSSAAEVFNDPFSSSYLHAKISGLPSIVIVDRNRKIRFKAEGFNEVSTETLRNFLDSLPNR